MGKPQISIHIPDSDADDLILSFQSKDSRKLMDILYDKNTLEGVHYGWKGIYAYQNLFEWEDPSSFVIIIDSDEARPELNASRNYLVSAPLKTVITTFAWLEKNHFDVRTSYGFGDLSKITYKDWRVLFSNEFLDWLNITSLDGFYKFKEAYENVLTYDEYPAELSIYGRRSKYFWASRFEYDIRYIFLAYLQLRYTATVSIGDKKVTMRELDKNVNVTEFDLFPTMFFVYGETEEDCSIMCSADSDNRIFIMANHKFISWLLKNAESLNKNYPRQFEQIVAKLKYGDAEDIIQIVDHVMAQLSKNAYKYGIDISNYTKLSMNDFYN